MTSGGPLNGVRIVEMAAIGPCPFAGMLLADMGATLIRVDRVPGVRQPIDELTSNDTFVDRGRKSIAINLKSEAGRAVALELIAGADALIEGFRPGVMERLGLGPEPCLARNPRLVYGRMTGWGQSGPLSQSAGHDLNYIALSGALHAMGPADRPPSPPLNLVGDYGGGGAFLALGVVAALLDSARNGRGQVVDAAMVDGAASLMTMMYSMRQRGQWKDEREANVIDGAAHFYGVYECADGRFLAVGAIEPQFYAELLKVLRLEGGEWSDQWNSAQWPALRARLAGIFRTRTRDDWCGRFAGTDACVAPVLKMGEAAHHPHLKARQTLIRDSLGRVLPAPAPRFERSAAVNTRTPDIGEHTLPVLRDLGLSSQLVEELVSTGSVHVAVPMEAGR
jgi:alpha-methylacyl-CoA racemase